MLIKSKKSAFIMGSIFILIAFVVSVVSDTVLPNPGDAPVNQESLADVPLLGWLALAFMFLLACGMMAVFIHEQDESHFGPRGAIRWAVAGVIYALLVKGVSLSLSRLEEQIFNGVIKSILQIVMMGLAYWIVFKLFPPREGQNNAQ